MNEPNGGWNWFILLRLQLEQIPDCTTLVNEGRVFGDGPYRLTDEIIERMQLLECFYGYVNPRHEMARSRLNSGTSAQKVEALKEFCADLGLAVGGKPTKQVGMLSTFLLSLLNSEHGHEVACAMRDQREPDVPIDVRRRAVTAVQNSFKCQSYGAARKALTRARREAPDVPSLKMLPIPGGDDDF